MIARAHRFAAPAAAAIAGVLQALSLAWPGSGQPLWWLQILSLAVLAGLLQRQSGWRGAAVVAWCFGTAWLVATFWWLFISMHVYGGLPALLAGLAVLLLAAFLALDYALAAALWRHATPRGPGWDAALFAALWLGAELLRGTLYTGFPWGAGGYAHVDGPLAVFAPWVGVYGIGALAAWSAYLLSLFVQHPAGSWRYWVAVLASAGLLAACNAHTRLSTPEPAGPRLRVGLLQGNIPQDEKFEGGTGIPLALEWYGKRLRDTDAQLVVAPETAIPLLPVQLPDGYLEGMRDTFARGARAALVGIPLGNFDQGYTNSVMGFAPGAAPYRYHKHHLVPFGEFIPPFFKWFTRMMNIPLGDFNRGDVGQPSFAWGGQRLAPNICYEDLFGEELGARFADPATAPTVFVNLSNIAWFGDTVAIDQHLQISRMRALEFERPMIRATNTGATAIIDRHGNVSANLPRLTRGVLVGEVEGGTAITPFARWVSRFGLWPLWAVAAVAALVGWRGRRPGAQP
ncbi:apolipoprotein N-acyltransferase [Ramlibacter sp. USB13]|uniref:Apolipoprotein N-acyltransferase n=1 Tax=Ramlibacter cellulosilyticus TaxID=2764187 RepID=A0A923SBK3_9BURK|nr:apolipoprotein N-acyltransferase [Ramlibacter cellulosilyticus]MBC5783955.1 apolipoprotein N-acyltransferase [Ramlibacter cellulosilyticus]